MDPSVGGKGKEEQNEPEKTDDGTIRSYEDMEIPPEYLQGDMDLTRSTEVAVKQMLYAEYMEKEEARRREEELTRQYLREESIRKQKVLFLCFGPFLLFSSFFS